MGLLEKVVWKYCQREKLSIYLTFAFIFNGERKWRTLYISMRRTLHGFDFSGYFDYLQEKENGVQFRSLQLHSHWFRITQWITWYRFALVSIKACWISCAFFQFVLRITKKWSCDKAVKLGNEILLQYYHEQVISVADKAKKSSDAKPIIKLVSSSVGEHVFRDLIAEIYIPSEEKTSVDENNGRLIALSK